jgi:imidazole glycerol phosphate synthase subunit HisF
LTFIKDEKVYYKNQNKLSLSYQNEPVIDSAIFMDVKKRFRDNRYDSFRVDFDIFKKVFADLTPWGSCVNVDLAEKLFRVGAKTVSKKRNL